MTDINLYRQPDINSTCTDMNLTCTDRHKFDMYRQTDINLTCIDRHIFNMDRQTDLYKIEKDVDQLAMKVVRR